MQQKLQTILFFTFLICVQISFINTLKIKNQFKSSLSANVTVTPVVAAAPAALAATNATATNATTPEVARLATNVNTTIVADAPAVTHHHHNHKATTKTQLKNNLGNIGTNNTVQEQQHRNQFHIHHISPQNLTDTNNMLRDKLNDAHNKLGQLSDIQKESLEARLFHKFPKKPAGIMNAAVIDLQKGKISEQSLTFNITSIQELSVAVSQANIQKTRTVTVNGQTYKLRKIGSNFFYGAIVGAGGIGAYLKDGFVTVITHNQFIGFDQFAYFFGQVISGLKQNKQVVRFKYFQDNFEAKKNTLKNRLTADKEKYNVNHGQQ